MCSGGLYWLLLGWCIDGLPPTYKKSSPANLLPRGQPFLPFSGFRPFDCRAGAILCLIIPKLSPALFSSVCTHTLPIIQPAPVPSWGT
jgi:hypothetical protein